MTADLWIIPMDYVLDEKIITMGLSSDEIERGCLFHFAKDRHRYLFFHKAFRDILSLYCNQPPKSLIFARTGYGKPFLVFPKISWHFNFSHSEDFAICAITGSSSIGVDIEKIKEDIDIDSLAGRFFSFSERSYLQARSFFKRYSAFYALWTGKEAYGKALGLGINFPLNEVTIPCKPFVKRPVQFKGLNNKDWNLFQCKFRTYGAQYMISCVAEQLSQNPQIFFYPPR